MSLARSSNWSRVLRAAISAGSFGGARIRGEGQPHGEEFAGRLSILGGLTLFGVVAAWQLAGISPLTPDFINREHAWPHVDDLRTRCETAGGTGVGPAVMRYCLM